jgi:uncharacterized phage protein (TIGR02220 family)
MRVHVKWTVHNGAILAEALADPRLSFRAKGLLAHMLSLSPGALADAKGLAKAASEGKEAINTALHELAVTGYCDRIEVVDEKAEQGNKEPDSEQGSAPMMDSLFGESFGPPVRMSELPEAQQEGSWGDEEDTVQRIIDHLNLLREQSWEWAQYTPLSARYAKNVEHISGRLHDGYAEEDLILVLEYLAATDGGKEESRRYFNCVTPFNTKNFESNLTMAREWEARGRPMRFSPRAPQRTRDRELSIYEHRLQGAKE